MYVYFLRTEGKLKIGKSRDPISRMKSLQTGCPTEIKLVGAIKCKSDAHALLVEKRFHEFFSTRHRRGEGFQCTDVVLHKVWELLNRLAEEDGYVKPLSVIDLQRIQSRAYA